MFSLAADARKRLGDAAGAGEALARAREVLERARLAGWRTPQVTATEAIVDLQQGRVESGARRLSEAIGEGWREYWLVTGHPALEEIARSSPAAEALDGVRRELESMLASLTDEPRQMASSQETR